MLPDNPILQDLWSYWAARRGTRRMPCRADIDPMAIPHLLPHLLLIEMMEDSRFRVRLAGTAIVESYGEELTGRFVDELFTPARRAVALRHYVLAFDSARPIAACNRYTNVRGTELAASRVILPLSEDGESVNMLLIGQTCAYAARTPEGLGPDTVMTDDEVEFLDVEELMPVG